MIPITVIPLINRMIFLTKLFLMNNSVIPMILRFSTAPVIMRMMFFFIERFLQLGEIHSPKNFLNIPVFMEMLLSIKENWGGKTANLSTPVIRCGMRSIYKVFAVN